MVPIVLVQPPEPPPAEAAIEAVLVSCSSGLPRGRCALAAHVNREREEARAVAVVREMEDGTFRVELKVIGEAGASREELTFREEDPEDERWRAAGFLIASLASTHADFSAQEETVEAAGAQGASEQPAGEAPAEQGEEPEPPQEEGEEEEEAQQGSAGGAATPDKRPFDRMWMALGPQLSLGVRGRSMRGGVMGRAGVRPLDLPLEFAMGVGWSIAPRSPEGVSVRVWSLEAGLSVPLYFTRSLRAAISGRFTTDAVAARAVSPEVGTSQQLSRWMIGSSWGASLAYTPGPLGVYAGADLLRFDGGTGITLTDEEYGSIPGWNFRALGGIRYAF